MAGAQPICEKARAAERAGLTGFLRPTSLRVRRALWPRQARPGRAIVRQRGVRGEEQDPLCPYGQGLRRLDLTVPSSWGSTEVVMTLVLVILAALIALFTAGTVVLVIVQRRPRSDRRRRRRRRTHLPASDEATHRHPPPIIFTVAGFPVLIGLAPNSGSIGTQ